MTSPSVSSYPVQERIGAGRIVLFCIIFFGLAVTEEVSNVMLPLTLQRLTADFTLSFNLPVFGAVTLGSAFVIGLILALNPLFGVIAQPLVGVISDRVWTRVGRRAFFIIISAPIVALCLVSVPLTSTMWKLVMIVVVYQFFQDVLWGSDHPLLADLFPSRQRGMVVGMLAISYQLGAVFVSRVGLAWVDAHDIANGGEYFGLPLYGTAAVLQICLVMVLAFFLWEKPNPGPPRPKVTIKSYVADFVAQPGLLRMGWIHFLRAFMYHSATSFLVLFGTITLGATLGDYARMMGWLPLTAMGYVWIVGMVADRVRRERMLLFGFGVSVVGYALAWTANTLFVLAIAYLIFGFAWTVLEITFKSLVTDFYPREMVGQLAGAINIFFAAGRTLAVISVGALVGLFDNNYRLIWIVAGVTGVVCYLVARKVTDPRIAAEAKVAAEAWENRP
jgi:MFS family permease